jgi:ribose/xylose/arabinose/galactoside ABC-type transport system permease subunit
MIALGMTMVICAGLIDISIGAQVALLSGFVRLYQLALFFQPDGGCRGQRGKSI